MRFIAFTARQVGGTAALVQDKVYHHTLIQAIKSPFGTVAHSFGAAVAVSTSVKSWKAVYMTSFMLYYAHPPFFGLHLNDLVEEETGEGSARSYAFIPGHLLEIEEVKELSMQKAYKEVLSEMAILTTPRESVYTIIAELDYGYEGRRRRRYIFKPFQFQPLI